MKFKTDLTKHREPLMAILDMVINDESINASNIDAVLRQYPKDGAGFFRRDELIRAYREFTETGDLPPYDARVLKRLRRKPVRTSSGVTPVTVLTKPFPCPGECIFCPNDIRMPKSYLADEPGAQRAEHNAFDPYLQTYIRLAALHDTGHPTEKIEMIILGGTWSFYPESYQIWFIKRIFDAMHDFGKGIDNRDEVWQAIKETSQFDPAQGHSNVLIEGVTFEHSYNQVVQTIYEKEITRSRQAAHGIKNGVIERTAITEFATWEELEAAHTENESAKCRCVGLVIETRPDHISEEEVLRVRRLGCTKVQIGFQSLNDEVLRLNKRGHNVAASRRAVKLLRQTGFKIHAHWMPNLYGSSPEADVADYEKLFGDPDFRPDELKVYPCSLIESAELMQYYKRGDWQPYSEEELLGVLQQAFNSTPSYCRLTRVIRDIPSTDIVVGNKKTNFRQIVENSLNKRSLEIRSREIRHKEVSFEDLHLDIVEYDGGCADELFLQYVTAENDIAGFLRLSLPKEEPLTDELEDSAMIREIHVYGQALKIGKSAEGKAQHLGLGKRLIEKAIEIAREAGYAKLAVISSVGTRDYYRQRGFYDGHLYQFRDL